MNLNQISLFFGGGGVRFRRRYPGNSIPRSLSPPPPLSSAASLFLSLSRSVSFVRDSLGQPYWVSSQMEALKSCDNCRMMRMCFVQVCCGKQHWQALCLSLTDLGSLLWQFPHQFLTSVSILCHGRVNGCQQISIDKPEHHWQVTLVMVEVVWRQVINKHTIRHSHYRKIMISMEMSFGSSISS